MMMMMMVILFCKANVLKKKMRADSESVKTKWKSLFVSLILKK